LQIQQESSELAGCCICVLNFAGYELNDIEVRPAPCQPLTDLVLMLSSF
jgi:hypothetical protein